MNWDGHPAIGTTSDRSLHVPTSRYDADMPLRRESRARSATPPLSPELLIHAYSMGVFPMADPDTGEIGWYSPDPRAIFPLDGFHIPRNVARLARQGRFEIRTDTRFEQVMRACAFDRSRDNRCWISEEMIRAYAQLHRHGLAHSVEAWRNGQLVGGLYGVHLGAAFFGESMFCRPDLGGSGASKVCLVHLMRILREGGFMLLDTQFTNPHVEQFGCVEIPREAYLERLRLAIQADGAWPAPGTMNA